ncbi:Proteasome activator PA28 C-terminal domain-containing protein [Plasmodiophora brassicae]
MASSDLPSGNDDGAAVQADASPEECRRQYREIIDGFSRDANEIIHAVLPAKVMVLQRLLKDAPEFNAPPGAVAAGIDVRPEPDDADNNGSNAKRRRMDGEVACVPRSTSALSCNSAVVAPLALLKTHLLDFIELIGTVKISIQLAIPRIEDGNNFGVSVQEETVSELSRAEDAVFNVLESIAGYFVTRAKIASKMIKYPEVQDYRMAVKELDEKMYVNVRLFCSDLRNNAALLHDLIVKNIEKIRTPRPSNHQSSMY